MMYKCWTCSGQLGIRVHVRGQGLLTWTALNPLDVAVMSASGNRHPVCLVYSGHLSEAGLEQG